MKQKIFSIGILSVQYKYCIQFTRVFRRVAIAHFSDVLKLSRRTTLIVNTSKRRPPFSCVVSSLYVDLINLAECYSALVVTGNHSPKSYLKSYGLVVVVALFNEVLSRHEIYL